MSTVTIISLSIVVLSIILVAVIGFVAYKKAKPALDNIQETKEVVNQKVNYFTREGEHIKERVDLLTNRVQGIQKEVDVKSAQFEDLTDEQGKFATSLRYLQSHAGEYTSGISKNVKDELKEDGPKLAETFKRAFKKTWGKQKVRYKK